MYSVLKIEPKGNRILVTLDNDISFMLYKGEIRKYHIAENSVIDEGTYLEIFDILYKRARERALYILDDNYKTVKQIREKLQNGYYPESIINRVISYLEEYGLIDDFRYALLYIDYKSAVKSKKQLIQELYVKGIEKEIIVRALEESGYEEEDSLSKVIEKKISKYDLRKQKDIQKFYRYLVSKGYYYSDIKKVLSKYIEEMY